MTDENQDMDTDTGDDADKAAGYVIAGFPQYLQREERDNWGWITAAVMVGNYYKSGPIANPRNTTWRQSALATTLCNSLDVSGNPNSSLAAVYCDNLASTNNRNYQNFSSLQGAIRAKSPVVVAWVNLRTLMAVPGGIAVCYGYGAGNWYYCDPSKSSVTIAKKFPTPPPPQRAGCSMTLFYTRTPPMGKKPPTGR